MKSFFNKTLNFLLRKLYIIIYIVIVIYIYKVIYIYIYICFIKLYIYICMIYTVFKTFFNEAKKTF